MSAFVQDRLLSVHEVAEYLGVSTRTVRRYIKLGHLPAARLVGGHLRISRGDVDALLTRGRERTRA